MRLLITNDPATNLPPVISRIADQTLPAGNSLTIPFFITAIGQPGSSLAVQASCEDPVLVPDSNLDLNGEGFDRTLTVRSTPARAGTANIKLTVTDGLGRLANRSFSLTVTGVVQGRINSAVSGAAVLIPAGTKASQTSPDTERGVTRPLGNGFDIGAYEFQRRSFVFRERSGATIVQFDRQPDRRYTVEASSDCVNWITVGDRTTGTSGILEFLDADAAKFPTRFYRTRLAESKGKGS